MFEARNKSRCEISSPIIAFVFLKESEFIRSRTEMFFSSPHHQPPGWHLCSCLRWNLCLQFKHQLSRSFASVSPLQDAGSKPDESFLFSNSLQAAELTSILVGHHFWGVKLMELGLKSGI